MELKLKFPTKIIKSTNLFTIFTMLILTCGVTNMLEPRRSRTLILACSSGSIPRLLVVWHSLKKINKLVSYWSNDSRLPMVSPVLLMFQLFITIFERDCRMLIHLNCNWNNVLANLARLVTYNKVCLFCFWMFHSKIKISRLHFLYLQDRPIPNKSVTMSGLQSIIYHDN